MLRKLATRFHEVGTKVIVLSVVTAAAILAFDVMLPLGVAGGVPYVALVMLGAWAGWRPYILVLAAAGSALTVAGLLASPPGGVLWMVLANRTLALAAVWAVAILLYRHRGTKGELRTVEGRLQEAIDSLPEAFMFFDADERLVLSNMAFREYYAPIAHKLVPGVRFEDWARTVAKSGLVPSAVGREGAWLAQRLADFRDPRQNRELMVGDRWVHIREYKTASGGTAGLRMDITERRRAEEALRAGEGKFRDFAESASDWFWELDENLCYSYVSKSFHERTGLSGKALIGVDVWEVAKGRYPDGELEPLIAAALERKPCRDVVARRVEPGEPDRWFSISGVPVVDDDGTFRGYRGVTTDITRRRLAEQALHEAWELYETVVELSPDAIVLQTDENGRIAYANEAARQLIGADSAADLIDKNFVNFLHPDHRDDARRRNRAVLAGETAETSIEGRFVTETGDIAEVERSVVRCEYRSGPALLSFVRDVSDRNKVNSMLRAGKQQAEVANRAKSEFLANMSHELRTPLNAIMGFAEMMQRKAFGDLGDPRYDGYVTDIHDSGSHLLGVINDILDLSKIEAGKFELYEETVDLEVVVQACLRIVNARAAENGLRILDDLMPDLPRLHADPRVLKQVVLNLLTNAIKFTRAGGSVTVSVELADDGRLGIVVADTGIGMDPDDLAKALAPFHQVDGSLARRQEGTGLGLPLVKSLIELHGGTMEVESELDIGTTVAAWFPPDRLRPAEEDARAG